FPALHRTAEMLGEALNEASAEVAEGRIAAARRALVQTGSAILGSASHRGGTSPRPADVSPTHASLLPDKPLSQHPQKQDGARDGQRWVSVQASTIDALCDRMSELAAAFGWLQKELRSELVGKDDQTARVGITNSLLHYRELLDSCVDA